METIVRYKTLSSKIFARIEAGADSKAIEALLSPFDRELHFGLVHSGTNFLVRVVALVFLTVMLFCLLGSY